MPPQTQTKFKRMEPLAFRAEECQSSKAGSPRPSFMGATIQTYIQDSLRGTLNDIQKSNTHLVEQVNYQVKVLVQVVNHNFQQLFNMQAAQIERSTRIEEMMRNHFNIPILEPPSTEPFQLFIDPKNPSTTTIIIPDTPPITSTAPPTTTPPPDTTTIPFTTPTFDPIPSRDLPLDDHILHSPSHSHNSTSSSSTEEILVTNQPSPSDILPPAPTEPTHVLPSSPTFTPHSPAHSSSLD